ncbi:NAD(P)H-binding protein [Saccharopolyspora erythraea]|uniref:NAD(P)H-binding protein n=1 Tax=Saccharopolyspora erythraea TaxID=1836 RepID=UPI001BADB263|nr:NAD(P)H-binding protein [Saccharopolyspora erythraea]QUH00268.1 NAD(P)H-binding protein [Saccharopolyspora erythraea]
MTQPPILVLAATGKTGRRVVTRLRAAGHQVRAASRSSDVRFDWYDPSTWPAALADVQAVYLVVPDDPAPIDPFVRQAVAAGVRRFVVLSGRGIDFLPIPGMKTAEDAVRATEAEWTILRANNFHQNYDEDVFLHPVREGEVALPLGDEPEPTIDVEDIAEVAVAALTEDGHAGRVYQLSGPRGIGFREAVELIGKATGRTIRYVELPTEEYVAAQVAQGVAEAEARFLASLWDLVRSGHVAAPTDDVRAVTGHAPRDFESYVERVAETGVWGPPHRGGNTSQASPTTHATGPQT